MLIVMPHLYPALAERCKVLEKQFDTLPSQRKTMLIDLAQKCLDQYKIQEKLDLVYICTHNSRRSHFGQIWAAIAAEFVGLESIKSYSGGTEATAFHPNAIHALQQQGCVIEQLDKTNNPSYKVSIGPDKFEVCFSKQFDQDGNPTTNFGAVMTCSDAEENCPLVTGAVFRVACTYDDPKISDDTPNEHEHYLERADQIALESLFLFSTLRSSIH